MVLAVSEEGFGDVFSGLRPGGTDCSTVRVEDIPTVAVMDHVWEFFEVAETDSDVMEDGDDFISGAMSLMHCCWQVKYWVQFSDSLLGAWKKVWIDSMSTGNQKEY